MILQIKYKNGKSEIINNILDICCFQPFVITIFFENGKTQKYRFNKEDMVTIHFVR